MSGRRRRRVGREGEGRFERRRGSGGQRRELLFIVIDNDVMSKLAGGGVVVPVAMGSMITEGEDAAATSARRESEKTMVMEEEQWLFHCFVEGDFCWKWCLESRHPLSATRPTAPRNKHIPPFQMHWKAYSEKGAA